jgi:hypothetical protein
LLESVCFKSRGKIASIPKKEGNFSTSSILKNDSEEGRKLSDLFNSKEEKKFSTTSQTANNSQNLKNWLHHQFSFNLYRSFIFSLPLQREMIMPLSSVFSTIGASFLLSPTIRPMVPIASTASSLAHHGAMDFPNDAKVIVRSCPTLHPTPLSYLHLLQSDLRLTTIHDNIVFNFVKLLCCWFQQSYFYLKQRL